MAISLYKVGFLERIQSSPPVVPGEDLQDEQWKSLLTVISGASVLRLAPIIYSKSKNLASILAVCAEHL